MSDTLDRLICELAEELTLKYSWGLGPEDSRDFENACRKVFGPHFAIGFDPRVARIAALRAELAALESASTE